MSNRLLIACSVLLVAASCSTTKISNANKNAKSIELDSIEITASRENPYRATATKDFDLVHAKLEVGFDYTKQQLKGKATITLKPHFYPQYSLTLDAKQFDMTLRRDFKIRENMGIQLRGELFNIFNTPNFGSFNNQVGGADFGLSTQMLGRSLSNANAGGTGLNSAFQIGGPRSIQLSARFYF